MRLNLRPTLIILFLGGTGIAIFGNLPSDTLAWRELQNFGHTPLSAVLSLIALTWLRAWPLSIGWPVRAHYIAAASSVLATGAAIEGVQWLIGRDAEWLDFGRDALGVVVALGMYAVFDKRAMCARMTQVVLCVSALLATVGAAAELVSVWWAYHARNNALPVLLDCASDHRFWGPREADAHCDNAPVEWNAFKYAIHVTQHPGLYPGIALREPYADWSGYSYLGMMLWVPGGSQLVLTLRAHDRLHTQQYSDRYNHELQLSPGENHVRIPLPEIAAAPLGRAMDLTSMRGVGLFSVQPHPPRDFFIGEIRLEN